MYTRSDYAIRQLWLINKNKNDYVFGSRKRSNKSVMSGSQIHGKDLQKHHVGHLGRDDSMQFGHRLEENRRLDQFRRLGMKSRYLRVFRMAKRRWETVVLPGNKNFIGEKLFVYKSVRFSQGPHNQRCVTRLADYFALRAAAAQRACAIRIRYSVRN